MSACVIRFLFKLSEEIDYCAQNELSNCPYTERKLSSKNLKECSKEGYAEKEHSAQSRVASLGSSSSSNDDSTSNSCSSSVPINSNSKNENSLEKESSERRREKGVKAVGTGVGCT